jgi:hypothetical protein
MPIGVTNTAAAGFAYSDIRVGECQVHQGKIDVSALTGVDDANNSLPVGLPILASGAPVTAGTDVVFGLIGPEPVKLGAADHFGNVIISGSVNRDAIEDNLGRALTANELAAIVLIKDRINLI